jgi:hypothetical protein
LRTYIEQEIFMTTKASKAAMRRAKIRLAVVGA